MKTRRPLKFTLISLLSLSAELSAEDFNKFYIQAILGSPIKEISVGDSTVGAPGYVSGCCSTGKMGEVDTAASKATLGLKLGYRLSETWRFDLSYYDLSYGNTTWGTDFGSAGNWPVYRPANATPMRANLSSNTVFASAYYSVNHSSLPKGLSPYFGIGLGSSWNEFKDGVEGSGDGYNTPWSNTKTSFAYKFDLGLEYAINKNFGIDAAVTFMDIGKFSSDSYRGRNGGKEAISPYTFSSDLAPIYNLGISYKF